MVIIANMKNRILLIEDSPELSGLVETLFSLEYPEVKIDIANTIEDAQMMLTTEDYDLVITDMMFPSGDIRSIFEIVRDRGIKLVLLTGMEPGMLKKEVEGYEDVILGVIRKPFSFEDFTQQFETIVRDFLPELKAQE